MKYLITIFLVTAAFPIITYAQDPNNIKSACQQELDKINENIKTLNDEYEHIKEDLKAGLYCSKCGLSKTELDKTEGFYAHLGRVQGQAVPATAQQIEDAHQRYFDKYNSLKNDFDSKRKDCDENYKNALKEQNDKIEYERQNSIKEQQEQLEKYQQNILAQSEKNKQDIINTFNGIGEDLKNSIHNLFTADNNGTISFKGNNQVTTLNSDLKNQAESVDDYSFDNNDLDTWQAESLTYLESKKYSVEEQSIFQSITELTKDPGSSDKLMELFTQHDSYLNILKENVQEKIENYFEDLPSKLIDKSVDETTSGQTKRDLHFIKNVINDYSERTSGLLNAAVNSISNQEADNSIDKYDFNPGSVFLQHTTELLPEDTQVLLEKGTTVTDIYNQIKHSAANPAVIINVATWVFAPEI